MSLALTKIFTSKNFIVIASSRRLMIFDRPSLAKLATFAIPESLTALCASSTLLFSGSSDGTLSAMDVGALVESSSDSKCAILLSVPFLRFKHPITALFSNAQLLFVALEPGHVRKYVVTDMLARSLRSKQTSLASSAAANTQLLKSCGSFRHTCPVLDVVGDGSSALVTDFLETRITEYPDGTIYDFSRPLLFFNSYYAICVEGLRLFVKTPEAFGLLREFSIQEIEDVVCNHLQTLDLHEENHRGEVMGGISGEYDAQPAALLRARSGYDEEHNEREEKDIAISADNVLDGREDKILSSDRERKSSSNMSSLLSDDAKGLSSDSDDSTGFLLSGGESGESACQLDMVGESHAVQNKNTDCSTLLCGVLPKTELKKLDLSDGSAGQGKKVYHDEEYKRDAGKGVLSPDQNQKGLLEDEHGLSSKAESKTGNGHKQLQNGAEKEHLSQKDITEKAISFFCAKDIVARLRTNQLSITRIFFSDLGGIFFIEFSAGFVISFDPVTLELLSVFPPTSVAAVDARLLAFCGKTRRLAVVARFRDKPLDVIAFRKVNVLEKRTVSDEYDRERDSRAGLAFVEDRPKRRTRQDALRYYQNPQGADDILKQVSSRRSGSGTTRDGNSSNRTVMTRGSTVDKYGSSATTGNINVRSKPVLQSRLSKEDLLAVYDTEPKKQQDAGNLFSYLETSTVKRSDQQKNGIAGTQREKQSYFVGKIDPGNAAKGTNGEERLLAYNRDGYIVTSECHGMTLVRFFTTTTESTGIRQKELEGVYTSGHLCSGKYVLGSTEAVDYNGEWSLTHSQIFCSERLSPSKCLVAVSEKRIFVAKGRSLALISTSGKKETEILVGSSLGICCSRDGNTVVLATKGAILCFKVQEGTREWLCKRIHVELLESDMHASVIPMCFGSNGGLYVQVGSCVYRARNGVLVFLMKVGGMMLSVVSGSVIVWENGRLRPRPEVRHVALSTGN